MDVIKVTYYVCTKCGTEHDNEEDAEACCREDESVDESTFEEVGQNTTQE